MKREVDALFSLRVTLIDLLMGRELRVMAAWSFDQALIHDHWARSEGNSRGSVTCLESHLEQAARIERIAAFTEQGLMVYGERFDRRGHLPEDEPW